MTILVASADALLVVGSDGETEPARFDGRHPTCVAFDPLTPGRAWCGTHDDGVFVSSDGGHGWDAAGLSGERIMAIAPSLVERDVVWVGTEPSAILRSRDAGRSWQRLEGLDALPSSSEWSFPPKPETHHVRWIACHPSRAQRLWIAIEAGALISTADGGATWRDRVPGGPYDTHELAIHPDRPDTLRVAAGDGYYESDTGGETWSSPAAGLDVSYLRSVAIDPGNPAVVVVSASTAPRTAYVSGKSDGRLYRRAGTGDWQRIAHGWPHPPRTIAPLLAPGSVAGQLWAADERGVHRTSDGGREWTQFAAFARTPLHLRGLAIEPA